MKEQEPQFTEDEELIMFLFELEYLVAIGVITPEVLVNLLNRPLDQDPKLVQ